MRAFCYFAGQLQLHHMTEYDFSKIEKYWQQRWAEQKTYQTPIDPDKPKYYVLDMFPYPSGAGLHVGHPLGYIASDIVARYKKLKGFNVLHPMGYDAFGLPAEQYAIQTGQHPAVTTKNNIDRYREQLDKIGLGYDWDREIKTCDPYYYRWTQWIFIQLFNSWYNHETDKAEPIDNLIRHFETEGFHDDHHTIITGNIEHSVASFTAAEWKSFSEKKQQEILLNFRLAYISEAYVNWCPAMGTVLANDEVKDGVSERGGYPVERKLMKQWSLRITAYAERLLNDLNTIEWSDSIKEAQRNWIGKSVGSSLTFEVETHSSVMNCGDVKKSGHTEKNTSHAELVSASAEIPKQVRNDNFSIEVFTTRPDTIFGVTFVTLAPEHELIDRITTPEYKKQVADYVHYAKNRSERERQADVKKITGQFTGAYAIHPFSGKKIPVWIGEYVLAGYGTGAVMGVPAHDSRDFGFAKHFGLDILQVIEAPAGHNIQEASYDAKEGKLINSDFLTGLDVKAALKKAIEAIEQKGIGEGKTNYRLRDAVFGRQRYWGEPIPVYYKDSIPYTLPESELPLLLPEVDKYLPTEDGEPPLARAHNWKYKGQYDYEHTTMPGWAGSSWYFLRYMDPQNKTRFASKEAIDYWQQVDLYLGGSEHATGHLLYVRFWTKFLYDLGHIPVNEPAKKLVNQGMIQGVSQYHDEIRINRNQKQSFEKNRRPLILEVIRNGTIIKKIDIPKELNQEGVHIFKNHGCKLEFRFRDPLTNEIIEVEPNSKGLSKAVYIEESSVNSVTVSHCTLKERWLRVEQYYKPIVITDFPIEAYWHYSDNRFNPEDNLDVWRSLDEKSTKIDLKSIKPLWVSKPEVEKMSKSKNNVVTPDDDIIRPQSVNDVAAIGNYWDEKNSFLEVPGIITQYGADTLRLYEMFLGPLEQSKPWSTQGIEGTFRFLKKLWRLFYNQNGEWLVTEDAPAPAELKVLHKTIKKVQEDIENLSFNTSVSAFMVCVNELSDLKCSKKSVLSDLLVLLSPFAPHICEELWSKTGNMESITRAHFPVFNENYLVESHFSYPISINGKVRTNMDMDLSLESKEVEARVLADETVQKWLEGKQPKKVIHVKGRIVNVVV